MEELREPLRVDTRLAVRGQMRSVGVCALNGKRDLCGGQACALVRGLGRPSCARGVGCPDVPEAVRDAQGTRGLWMSAGLNSAGVGLPVRAHLRGGTTTHNAVPSPTPFP